MSIISKSQVNHDRYRWVVPKSEYRYARFSDMEYKRRWKLVKGLMEEKGLDCLLINAGNVFDPRGWFNMKWLTNYMGTLSHSSYLIIPIDGEPMITDSPNCAERPDRRARSLIEYVRGGNPLQLAIRRLEELKLKEGNIGIVEQPLGSTRHSFPHADYELFRSTFPKVNYTFVTEEFNRFHLVKSSEEIKAVERAAKITDIAIESLIEKAKPGMKELELFAIVSDAFLRSGAEYPSMILLTSMSMENPHTCMGRMHPVDRTLKRGDIIITEIGARDETSYESQTGKPICLGNPTREFQDMFDACIEAYKGVKSVLRVGSRDEDIKNAAKVVLERGYHWDTPILHGMQPPGEPMTTFKGPRPRIEEPLKAGTVLVLETNAARKDLTAGVMLDDTFVITDGGVRCLNKFPPQLTII